MGVYGLNITVNANPAPNPLGIGVYLARITCGNSLAGARSANTATNTVVMYAMMASSSQTFYITLNTGNTVGYYFAASVLRPGFLSSAVAVTTSKIYTGQTGSLSITLTGETVNQNRYSSIDAWENFIANHGNAVVNQSLSYFLSGSSFSGSSLISLNSAASNSSWPPPPPDGTNQYLKNASLSFNGLSSDNVSSACTVFGDVCDCDDDEEICEDCFSDFPVPESRSVITVVVTAEVTIPVDFYLYISFTSDNVNYIKEIIINTMLSGATTSHTFTQVFDSVPGREVSTTMSDSAGSAAQQAPIFYTGDNVTLTYLAGHQEEEEEE